MTISAKSSTIGKKIIWLKHCKTQHHVVFSYSLMGFAQMCVHSRALYLVYGLISRFSYGNTFGKSNIVLFLLEA